MKKLLFVPALVGFLLISGCQTEEPTNDNIDHMYEVGGVDAEAALLTAHALSPTGLEFVNPPLFMATVGAAAIVASTQQAFVLFRHTSTNALDGITTLDDKYLLPNNPYEKIGIGHNKGLATLSSLGRQVTAADLDQDEFMLKLINCFGSFTKEQQQAILQDIRNNQAYTEMLSNADLIINAKGNTALLPNVSNQHKTYISNFISEIRAMDKGGDFKDRLFNKVNRDISNLLVAEEGANTELIIYLTVFKHSVEYWY